MAKNFELARNRANHQMIALYWVERQSLCCFYAECALQVRYNSWYGIFKSPYPEVLPIVGHGQWRHTKVIRPIHVVKNQRLNGSVEVQFIAYTITLISILVHLISHPANRGDDTVCC